MAARGKAKEYQIQVEIESQEDWEEQISKEGLLGLWKDNFLIFPFIYLFVYLFFFRFCKFESFLRIAFIQLPIANYNAYCILW